MSVDITTKAQVTKAKIIKEDYIKLKNIYTAKEIIKKLKGSLRIRRKHLQSKYLLTRD
jgi:inorganic triphosphatase YgiF